RGHRHLSDKVWSTRVALLLRALARRHGLLQDNYVRQAFGRAVTLPRILAFRKRRRVPIRGQILKKPERGGLMRVFLIALLAMVLALPEAYAQSAGYRIQRGDTLT